CRENLTAAFCAGGDGPALREAIAALAQGSAADQKRSLALAAWWEAPAAAGVTAYIATFLTNEGDIRANLSTQAARKATAIDLAAVLAAEAARVLRHGEACGSASVIEATEALVTLGDALLDEYDRRKTLHGQLDYDDLIGKTLALLRRPGVAPWVLFKLDGGLDHILIDEAQDTNPEQWDIVSNLAEEFFAGEGARAEVRTVFAVGDPKQSIFSFQRADPASFARMRDHFKRRVDEARALWNEIPLTISFRSTAAVLDAVNAIFARPEAQAGL